MKGLQFSFRQDDDVVSVKILQGRKVYFKGFAPVSNPEKVRMLFKVVEKKVGIDSEKDDPWF